MLPGGRALTKHFMLPRFDPQHFQASSKSQLFAVGERVSGRAWREERKGEMDIILFQ